MDETVHVTQVDLKPVLGLVDLLPGCTLPLLLLMMVVVVVVRVGGVYDCGGGL